MPRREHVPAVVNSTSLAAPLVRQTCQRARSYIDSLHDELVNYRQLMRAQQVAVVSGSTESLRHLTESEAASTRRMTDLSRCIGPLLSRLGIAWPGREPTEDSAPEAPAEVRGVLGALWSVEQLRREAIADNRASLDAIRQRMPEVRDQLEQLKRRDPAVRRSSLPEQPSFIDLQA